MTIVIDIGSDNAQFVRDVNFQRAQTVADTARSVASDQFVFLAAFYGTSNDKDKALPGEQSTNVYQLTKQVI